ncbi:MAG: amidase family protein, partial [Steroidobacteraceae bacterium]
IYSAIAQSEFKQQIPGYLETTGPSYPKTLDDLVRLANDPATGYPDPHKAFAFKYTASIAMEADDPRFVTAHDQGMALIKAGVDAVMAKEKLDTIVTLSSPAAATPITPPANPKPNNPRGLPYNIANLSGYPEIVVPAGMTPEGLPVTISFLGRAFSDGPLLGFAYDFEQATHALRLPRFTPALASDRVGR